METSRKRSVQGVVLAATLLLAACSSPELALVWTPMDDVNEGLSSGVSVYQGIDRTFPLQAWYARVPSTGGAEVRIHQSDDTSDNRETVASFAADEGACVAVNGGYFTMGETPAAHGGLLVEDGTVRWGATRSVTRDSISYPTARAAIGIGPDGSFEINWVTSSGDSVLAWDHPIANVPDTPGVVPSPQPVARWDVVDALAAGPLLMRDGEIAVAANEEVFFGSSIPAVHPRTAAGVTAEGDLILLVVDGRQPVSRGVNLEELASILMDLGAVDALNLDGGGSSTLIANGELLNRPGGGTELREVMSAITVRCAN